jgi:hypothetical protein
MAKKQGGGKLLPLPFTTFGELAALGLKAAITISPFCPVRRARRRGKSSTCRSTSRPGRRWTADSAIASSARAAAGPWLGISTAQPGGRPTATSWTQHASWWNSADTHSLQNIGNTGGRNGSCRIAVALGHSHSHSAAHVGAGLAALVA